MFFFSLVNGAMPACSIASRTLSKETTWFASQSSSCSMLSA